MKAVINISQRKAKQRAHTGTHLLHQELRKIIPGTKQAGSLVEEDYIRFDFTSSNALDNNQIKQIEENINTLIKEGLDVHTKEMSLQEAINNGAIAFFEEKYQDTVRVVTIGENDPVSIELCGGTHIDNTGNIGAFKVIGQEAVASGIRRIIAVTGPKVTEKFHEQQSVMERIGETLKTPVPKIEEKINKLIKENKELQQEKEKLENNLILSNLTGFPADSSNSFDKIINTTQSKVLSTINFKKISQLIKDAFPEENILVYSNEGNFVIHTPKQDIKAKDLLQEYGLKGGGPDFFVQGKDENIKNLIG